MRLKAKKKTSSRGILISQVLNYFLYDTISVVQLQFLTFNVFFSEFILNYKICSYASFMFCNTFIMYKIP